MSIEGRFGVNFEPFFIENFESEFWTSKIGGLPSNVSYVNGIANFNGSNSSITYLDTKYVKSVRIKLKLNSTTEDVLKLNSTVSLTVSSGTIIASGFKIYVNGILSSSIDTNNSEIMLTSSSLIVCDDIIIGLVSNYLNGQIELIEFYNYELTHEEIKNLYNNNRYKYIPTIQKEELGNEISTSSWVALGGSISIDSDIVTYSNVSATNNIRQSAVGIGEGNKYMVYINVLSITGIGTFNFKLGGGANIQLNLGINTIKLDDATVDNFQIISVGGGGNDIITFVNSSFSVKEILVEEYQEILSIDTRRGVIYDKWENNIINKDVNVNRDGSSYVMNFNGVSSFLNIDSIIPTLSGTKYGTWACWIKLNSIGNIMPITFSDTNSNSVIQLNLFSDFKIYASLVRGAPIWRVVTTNQVIKLNKWHHIVLSHDGSIPRIYLDGGFIDQVIDITTDKTQWFANIPGIDNGRIGARRYNNSAESNFTEGNIGIVKIFKGVLTSKVISQLYTSTKRYYK